MNKLHLTDEQLYLVSRALDLYSRMGLGQFWYLTDNITIQKNIWKREKNIWKGEKLEGGVHEKFKTKAQELSNIYTGFVGNGSYGIFSPEVGDDCKLAAHIHQTIRHEFWKRRRDEDPDASYINMTVDSHPADIWNMAKGEKLEIKIEKDENQ
jgi:hypothetical protein